MKQSTKLAWEFMKEATAVIARGGVAPMFVESLKEAAWAAVRAHEEEVAKPRGRWSRTPPSEPGIYWICDESGAEMTVADVDWVEDPPRELVMFVPGEDHGQSIDQDGTLWWTIPIKSPKV